MDQPDVTETTRLQELYPRRVAARGGEGSHVTPEALLAVVQQEGSEPERLATLDHVMACAVCYREYQWLTAVDRAGVEAERAEGGAAARPRRAWWQGGPLAMAASVAAAVAAAVVLAHVVRSGPERERGTAGGIALVGPGTRAVAGQPLAFAWHPLPGIARYVLEVQGPDGSVILADTTADTALTLSQPGRLLPDSAYRWWVREVTEGSEPRSSAFRELRLTAR
jgi:hypothetical protein